MENVKSKSNLKFSDVRFGMKAQYRQSALKLDFGFTKDKIIAKDMIFSYKFRNNVWRLGIFYEQLIMSVMESSVDQVGINTCFSKMMTDYRKMTVSSILCK